MNLSNYFSEFFKAKPEKYPEWELLGHRIGETRRIKPESTVIIAHTIDTYRFYKNSLGQFLIGCGINNFRGQLTQEQLLMGKKELINSLINQECPDLQVVLLQREYDNWLDSLRKCVDSNFVETLSEEAQEAVNSLREHLERS